MIFINSYNQNWKLLCEKISKEKTSVEFIANDVSMNKLSDFLISAEDHRYKYHLGFDIIAILRAMKNNFFHDKKEGASTIEQQLVRVLTNDFRRNYSRKFKEILFAFSLKFIVDKKIIALIYLNVAYYGTNLDGLDKILKKYNLKKGDLLSDEICAEIVSRLKYPEPKNNKEKRLELITKRKKHILRLYNYHSTFKIIKVHG